MLSALRDVEPATKTPFDETDAGAEFEISLTNLMPHLRVFARSLSGKRELAEDLCQAALIKAWRSRRSFTPGSNLRAWLFTILRNEYSSYRRRAWRQVPWDATKAETIAAPSGEQQAAVELRDTACAMRSLPIAQREALILVGLGGFSYADAAALSGCAEGTAKSRVARARLSLKTMLEGRTSLPTKSCPAKDNAVNEILAQLSHLTKAGSPRAVAAN